MFQRSNRSPKLSLILIPALLLGLAFTPAQAPAADAPGVEAFARCIAKSGARFYGAHWCGFCKKQKDLFGAAAIELPYVECSEAGSKNQLPACEGINGYPTWKMPNGEVKRGMQNFAVLADATGCKLP